MTRNGFLQPVMKGWLLACDPATGAGDPTPWFAAFWEFVSRYAEKRFGEAWHLSPELSLLLRAANTTVPRQLVLYSPLGTNNALALPFDSSLYDLKHPSVPPKEELEKWNGLRLYRPEAALLKVPENFFRRHPVEAQLSLNGIGDPSQLLRRLLEGGHSSVAGRLAGAFRRVGRPETAREFLDAMAGAGHDVREVDPFSPELSLGSRRISPAPPIVGRLHALWARHRKGVLTTFPDPPERSGDPGAYLAQVEDAYPSDAYHSLSIEGYQVTPELVEGVRRGRWDPGRDPLHGRDRDALAARGYWQAFQSVKEAVAGVLAGGNAASMVREAHRVWYRAMFQPMVEAGILPPGALAGYRNQPVYIRGSRHVPPQPDMVREGMPTLFDLLEEETEPSVRAVLGHWMFGYIHPFSDGNGRIARFLMNLMLASGGYPWTVIRLEDRSLYMSAFEEVSIGGKILPFASCVLRAMEPRHSVNDDHSPHE